MDEHLRRLLRDRDSTPEHCYWHLARAGYSEHEIDLALIQAGKLPGQLGFFEDLQVRLGIKLLSTARQQVADIAFDEHEFDDPVVAVNGWDYENETSMARVAFLEPHYDEDGNELDPGERDSIRVQFSITFRENSAVPSDISIY